MKKWIPRKPKLNVCLLLIVPFWKRLIPVTKDLSSITYLLDKLCTKQCIDVCHTSVKWVCVRWENQKERKKNPSKRREQVAVLNVCKYIHCTCEFIEVVTLVDIFSEVKWQKGKCFLINLSKNRFKRKQFY